MTRIEVEIRQATAEDAELLSELGSRTFRDTFGPDNTASDMDAYLAASFGPDIQARELADPDITYLIACIGATAMGYARLRSGPAPECVKGARPIEIVRFYVARDHISEGIGRILMLECLGHARSGGHDVVWLDVWERNPRAITFYSKAGFEVIGSQDFVLGTDVQHDLLMERLVD